MWFGRDRDLAERLEARAHEALGAGQLEEALALAEQLLDMGWSGGFEVRALVQLRAGDPRAAIATLEVGVSKVPEGWHLWHLLGNLRSDAGALDAALAALDAALGCEDAPQAPIRFNRAVVQHRRGEPGKALDDLEPILALPRPPAFAEDALGLAAECLAEIGRAEDGRALVEAALEACAPDDPRRPRLDAEHALALDRAGAEAGEALGRALDGGAATPALLALLRRLEPARCAAPKLFRLVVQGPVEREDADGALRVVELVADDADQALALARRLLPPAARDDASVDRHQIVEEPTEREPGVHAAGPLAYFAED